MQAIQEFIGGVAGTMSSYVPNAIAAVIILVVGWVLAYLISQGVARLLKLLKIDQRLQGSSDKPRQVELFLSRLVYYLLLLCVLVLVLEVLGVQGALLPIRNMLDKALSMLPNFLAAFLIGVIGLVLAKMLGAVVTAVTRGMDGFSDKLGLGKDFSLSSLLGQLVFVFTFVPILIAALDALKIESVSVPATQMLQALLMGIPNILAAGLILAVAFFLGRFVTNIVSELLRNLGADQLPAKIGLGQTFGQGVQLSRVVGYLVLMFIMLGASISAAEKLGMPQVTQLLASLTKFAGQVVLGVVILMIGNLIASLAYKALKQSPEQAFLAAVARVAIIGLVLAIGLRAMGIADDIIRLAFGLSVGAIAVAVALSFGLGGREAAGKKMDSWLNKLKADKDG